MRASLITVLLFCAVLVASPPRFSSAVQMEDILNAAKRVADFIVHRAVPEGGGFKYAQFYSLEELKEAESALRPE